MTDRHSVRCKVQCTVCGRTFIVDKATSRIPKHSQMGEKYEPGIPYVACPGSGQVGMYVDTVLPNNL